MTAAELLQLVAQLDSATVDKMAHALGWPTGFALTHGGSAHRAKWANPFRNYYCGTADDPYWLAAQALGLAKIGSKPRSDLPYTTWTVTELGQAVVRLRLQAIVLARKVTP